MSVEPGLFRRCAIRTTRGCFFALVLSTVASAQTVSCPVTTSATLSGTYTVGAATCVVQSGVTLTVGLSGDVENFLNNPTEQSNGSVTVPGSTILNDGTITNNGSIYNYGGTGTSTITNFGTLINKNLLDNTGYFAGNSVLTNAGIFDNDNEGILYSGVLNNVGILTNAGTLDVENFFGSAGLTNFVGGVVNNVATITIEGEGNGTLTNGGTLTNFVGAEVTNEGALTNTGSLVNNGTLTNSVGGVFTNTGSLTNTGTMINDGTFNTSSGVGFTNSGAFVNNGGDVAEFITVLGATASMTNNGSFTNSSSLVVGAGPISSPGVIFYNNLGATLLNSGTYTPAFTVGSITIDNGASLINYGTLTNDSSLTETHAAVLNNYGAFTNSGGSVSVGTGSTLNNFAGSSFVQTSGITTVDGTISSVPAVQFQGGSLIGTGSINGNVNNTDAFVSPGDQLSGVFSSNGTIATAGTLTINGNYTQGSSGALGIFLAGDGELNLLDVSGLATLDGYVDFLAVNGFTPTAGDDFTFLDFGSLSGAFAGVNFLGWNCPTGDTCDLVYGANSVSLDILGPSSSSGGGSTNAPEPSSILLLGIALLALGVAACSRRRRAALAE